MNEPYAEDFFVVNRWLLRCAGLWSPNSRHKIVLVSYKIYSIGIFLVNIFFTATEFASFCYTYRNEYDLLKNISIALTHLMGAIKIVFFYFQKRKFLEIMSTLESKEFRYGCCEEKCFFPGLTSKRYKNTGIRCTVLFFLLAHVTLAFSYLPPTTATLWLIYTKPDEQQNLYKLPYYSWVPFRYDTAESFLVALGFQAIPMFSYAYR